MPPEAEANRLTFWNKTGRKVARRQVAGSSAVVGVLAHVCLREMSLIFYMCHTWAELGAHIIQMFLSRNSEKALFVF
jgi:hypothetical protein